jgi:hypothetical protein
MTGAQEGGLARDFRQNAQGAAEAANMGATLLMNAGNNPTSLGVPGSMVRWAGNLVPWRSRLNGSLGRKLGYRHEDVG